MKQAESTVDQLSDRPLEGISAHRDHAIIVLVLTRNSHSQIKMRLPLVAPIRNPLIIEQSWKTRAFDQVSVTRCQVEAIACTRTAVMSNNTGTAANPQQDVMIQPAKPS